MLQDQYTVLEKKKKVFLKKNKKQNPNLASSLQ